MKLWQIIITSVILLIASLLAWLMTTESGLRWGIHQVAQLIPGQLQTDEISGRLIGPVTVQNVRFEQNGTVVKIENISLDWRPSRLLKGELNIGQFSINQLDLTLPDKQADNKPFNVPDIQFPLAVKIEQFRITDIAINQPGQRFQIDRVSLNANARDDNIHIHQFMIKAPRYQVNISGMVQTSNYYEHQLTIDWQTSTLPDKTISGHGNLAGSLEDTKLTHQITQPVKVALSANIKNIIKELSWRAELNAENLIIRELNPDWPDASLRLALQGKGDLNTADIEGLVNGNYEDIEQLNAKLEISRQPNNRIDIKHLQLTQTGNQATVNTRGFWQPAVDGGNFELSFDWEKMQWPLKIDTANCKSGSACPEADRYIVKTSDGRGQLKGKPDQYHITLQSGSDIHQLGHTRILVDANGNLDGIKLHSLEIKTPAGSALAHGDLLWTPEISWTATVKARDINPEIIDPEWPGQLQAGFVSTGRIKSGKLTATVKDLNSYGNLRGYPVNLTGQLAWQNDQTNIDQLYLRSANSTLNMNGMIGKNFNLKFNLKSPNLSELYPDAGGALYTHGTLTGKTNLPVINAQLEGRNLSFENNKVEKITGHLAADIYKWKQLDIDITANNIVLNDRIIQTALLNVDKRQIQAQATSDELQIEVAMTGDITADGWSGELQQASFTMTDVTQWQLDQPSKITLSAETIMTDPLCWHDNREGKACITLEHKKDRWEAMLNIKRLSLVLLKYWLPELMTVEGLADIKSTLTYAQAGSLFGNMDIHIDQGRVTYPLVEGGREEWDYRQADISVSLKPDGISAIAKVDVGESEKINANVNLPGARLPGLKPATQPLRADATLQIQNLGLIAALIPEIDRLAGNIKVNLNIAGTLNKPTIAGELALKDGSVNIPKLGLNITAIKLQGSTTAMQQFNYQLDATSGEGSINITGRTHLDRKNGWPTKLSIKGKSFQVAKIPEAQIVVDPDLEMTLQAKEIMVEGKVFIPFAKLQPKDISRAARVSEDVVIIGNEVEEMEKWQLTSRIRVILGDRVSFFGYGFEGRVGGNLLLEDVPGQITKATGEINVPEGRYRAYGQRLEVEHGRMLFSGGPPTNPGLDLRAIRKVGTITAGIKVKGTLKNPQLELFSIPTMGQTDTLSYLLLGRPIETTNTEDGNIMARAALAMGLSGGDRIARSLADRFGIDELHVDSSDDGSQASLVLGRYLSPKLYISYGVGLIEAVNTINVRYQISDKWQLTGESGLHQGADILYTIER